MRQCLSALSLSLFALSLAFVLTPAPAGAQKAPCNPAVRNCG